MAYTTGMGKCGVLVYSSAKPVLAFPTHAQLTWEADKPTYRENTVTHPNDNRARRTATSLIMHY